MMHDAKYKCLIVEDEALIRRNLVKKINQIDSGFVVIGEAKDGESAIQIIDKEIPHLVITDIQMPVKNGIDLIKYISSSYPHMKVIIISGFDEFEYARQAIKYEVKDYLIKPVSEKELLSSMLKIKMLLDSEIAVLESYRREDVSSEELVELIELYIKNNYRNDISIAEIAEHLHFTADHLSRIYKKIRGKSLLQYLIDLRINEAKHFLLTHPEMSVKTVGEIIGYTDQYYFSKFFKKCTGYNPTDYRAMKLKKQ